MNFGDAVRSGFKKYFDFSGRAPRSEYWFWMLFTVVLGIGATAIDIAFDWGEKSSEGYGPVATLSIVGTFFPSLAVSVRRLHDTDRSGWWLSGIFLGWIVFVLVLVLIGADGNQSSDVVTLLAGTAGLGLFGVSVALIVFYCLPGSPGANRYGPSGSLDQEFNQKSGDVYSKIDSGNDFNASRWILSGFDSVGNIIRLEFDTNVRGGKTFIIGRNRDMCDLVIADSGVSRRHAEISVTSAGVFIRDLGSANGTIVNGQKLTGDPLRFPVNGTLGVGPIELSIFGS